MADSCVSDKVWACSDAHVNDADAAFECLDTNGAAIHACPSFEGEDTLFGKKAKKVAAKKAKAKRVAKKLAKKLNALQSMEEWHPSKDEFCAVMSEISQGEMTPAQCMTGANCAGNWDKAQICIAAGNAAGAADGEEAGWEAGLGCLA
jgi:hypothetical protein